MKRIIAVCTLLLLFTSCSSSGTKDPGSGGKPGRTGMMPKLVGIPYFTACEKGAKEAAKELGIDLDYDGPTSDRVEDQVKMIDSWIAQGYDVIAVAANDPEVIAPALQRAKKAGATILTWDADANPAASGRATFVNQAPADELAKSLVEMMAKATGGEGTYIIVTGSATSPNQNVWMKLMREYIAKKYPKMNVLAPLVPDEDQNKAQRLTAEAINAHKDLKGIWGITSVSLPGAAKAVQDAGKAGQIYVTGLSLPSKMSEFVKAGTVKEFVLWDPVDLGYLTVHIAKRLQEGPLKPGKYDFGRLKGIEVRENEVVLGPPLVFNIDNIDKYDF